MLKYSYVSTHFYVKSFCISWIRFLGFIVAARIAVSSSALCFLCDGSKVNERRRNINDFLIGLCLQNKSNEIDCSSRKKEKQKQNIKAEEKNINLCILRLSFFIIYTGPSRGPYEWRRVRSLFVFVPYILLLLLISYSLCFLIYF